MPGCIAVGCCNRTEDGKIMKVFPRNTERRLIWAARVKREGWKPSNNSFLCEDHFSCEQWELPRADGKRILKLNAVPNIFNYKPEPKIRRPPRKREHSPKNSCTKENAVKVIIMDHNYFSKYTQENSEHIEESIVESLETQYEDNIELIQHEQFQINLLLDETKAYKIENIELHNKIKKLSNICKMQFNKIKHLRASLLKYKEEKRKSKRKYKDSQTLHNFLNKDQVSALSQKSTRGSLHGQMKQ